MRKISSIFAQKGTHSISDPHHPGHQSKSYMARLPSQTEGQGEGNLAISSHSASLFTGLFPWNRSHRGVWSRFVVFAVPPLSAPSPNTLMYKARRCSPERPRLHNLVFSQFPFSRPPFLYGKPLLANIILILVSFAYHFPVISSSICGWRAESRWNRSRGPLSGRTQRDETGGGCVVWCGGDAIGTRIKGPTR